MTDNLVTSQNIIVSDIESHVEESFSNDKQCFNETCCVKSCLSVVSLLMTVTGICDIYYAVTDTTCLGQHHHGLVITLRAYLLSSGIIVFVAVGAFNIALCFCDINVFHRKKYSDVDGVLCCLNCSNFISRLFSIIWLILGCVLFWRYTNIAECSNSVRDYLFARFIIFIFCTFVDGVSSNKE